MQAFSFGEDANFQARLLWSEINGIAVERYKWDDHVKAVPGVIITDSRGIFDATKNESPLHGLRQARSGYELQAAIEQANKVGTVIRWVHSGAMLADCLTKAGYPARGTFDLFMTNKQRWKIVHDEKFESQRRRTKKGLTTLQNNLNGSIKDDTNGSIKENLNGTYDDDLDGSTRMDINGSIIRDINYMSAPHVYIED